MTPGPAVAAPAVARAGGDVLEAPGRATADASLLDAVADLRRDVAATRLILPIRGYRAAERLRKRLLDQLDDHLLPRLRELSAPAVVVVAGSTGAGKSTLVNSLLGEEVSAAGVLRPTTREPVLVHHPADGELLAAHPLLDILDVKVHDAVPRGLTIVDAPDLDSLLASNRETAARLLDAADLWVFLTTAARYGDALPWEVLAQAAERGVSMAMVLNRVPPAALATIRADLMGRLRERGMGTVPLFLVPDLGPHQGMLEPTLVAPIRRWLAMVAGPDRARSVILRTQKGTLRRLQPWVAELADAVQAQVDARPALERLVADAVADPADHAGRSVVAGGMAAGAIRAQWAAGTTRPGPLADSWTSRRGRPARDAVLAGLADELVATVAAALAGSRRGGEASLAYALQTTKTPGAAAVPAHPVDPGEPAAGPVGSVDTADAVDAVDAGPTPVPTPEQAAADWLSAARAAVPALLGATDRKVSRGAARLAKGIGEDGIGTLVALAAAGLGGAASALITMVGAPTTGVVATLREDLARRAGEQARAAAVPALAFLADPALADDASAALRLRFAVLKGLR